jgi:hypothetical protein
MALLFFGCHPKNDSATTLDLEVEQRRIQAEVVKDEARDTMMRVMQPDPAQRSALDQAYTARDEAVGAWLAGEKGHRLIALEAKMRTAAKAKDLNGVRAATSQATPLRNELRELVASHQAAILDVFSPAQQLQWSGYEVASAMLALMEPLNLAPDQIAAIEQGGPSAVAQAMDRGAANPKAEAYLALEQWAKDAVLSAEQTAQYGSIKESKPMRSLSL